MMSVLTLRRHCERERARESSWSCVCVGVVKESARLRLSAGCQVAQVATQNIFVCMYVCMYTGSYKHMNMRIEQNTQNISVYGSD